MDKLYKTLLDTRARLMEAQHALAPLYEGAYRGKDGHAIKVKNPASNEGNGFQEEVGIEQCQSAATREQCYAHRDNMGNQGCLFMPDLAHLNPPLEGQAAKDWKTLKTAHCVDKRIVPFPFRKATDVDQEALQSAKMLKGEKKLYQSGRLPTSDDISDEDIEEPNDASDAVVKMYTDQIEKHYQAYSYNDGLHDGGNLIPLFWDKNGDSTYKKVEGLQNSIWDVKAMLHGTSGTDQSIDEKAAIKMQRMFRNTRNKLGKKMNGRVRAKLDKAYENWEKEYKKLQYKPDMSKEERNDIANKKLIKEAEYKRIVGRTIFEAAKDPTNFSDQDLKEIVLRPGRERAPSR